MNDSCGPTAVLGCHTFDTASSCGSIVFGLAGNGGLLARIGTGCPAAIAVAEITGDGAPTVCKSPGPCTMAD